MPLGLEVVENSKRKINLIDITGSCFNHVLKYDTPNGDCLSKAETRIGLFPEA